MTYYEDRSECSYFGSTDGRLLAVGWLDQQHPFSKGRVSQTFFESLARLIADAWQPLAFGGRHACELCVFTGGPSQLQVGNMSIPVGATNVFIPAEEGIYVAPSLIIHYIDAHKYAPPEVLQRAVEACPPMRSMPYLKAMRQHGIDRLGNGTNGRQ